MRERMIPTMTPTRRTDDPLSSLMEMRTKNDAWCLDERKVHLAEEELQGQAKDGEMLDY